MSWDFVSRGVVGGELGWGTKRWKVEGSAYLLQGLHHNTQKRSVRHTWPREDLIPRMRATRSFGLELKSDVIHLAGHFSMILRDAIRKRDRSLRAVDLAFTVVPPGTLAHEHDAASEDSGEDEADAHGDAPGLRSVDAFCAVVDYVGEEYAERDEKLIHGDQRTADLTRSSLGLVHWRHYRECSHAESSDETANCDLHPLVGGGDLDDYADSEDDIPDDDGDSAA